MSGLKKRMLASVLVVATMGLLAAFATTASATPGKSSRCTGCHSGSNVAVTATQLSNNGTNATYNFSAPSADAVTVFNGSTKVGSTIQASSGRFTVPVGSTYTLYAVAGPGTNDGIGSRSVSPVAPAPVDTTPPTTTSNRQATYVGSAGITLSAVDNAGGSGVAHTYCRLDGATQAEGVSVSTSALGSHTLEFWSVDVAANAETHKNVVFEITAPPVPVPDTTAPTTTSNANATYAGPASITLSAVDNAGGSGVAHVYYTLDGVPQVEGTLVSTSVLGSHVLSFWSVDASGNAEAANLALFEVTAAAVATRRCTIALNVHFVRRNHRVSLSGMISPASVGAHPVLYVKRPGSTKWIRLTTLTARTLTGTGGAKWTYLCTPKLRGTYRFQTRFAGMVSNTTKVAVR